MRVLLINPTSHFELIGNNPTALESSRGFSPPLGILLLAGYLETHSEHHVEVFDAQAEMSSWQDIGRRVSSFAPDVVGLTVMTQTLIDVLRIVEIVKVYAPDATIVLGGPHVHLFPRETIQLPGVDYLVLGEGEVVFSKLLDNLHDISSIEKIGGLVFRKGDEVVNTGAPEFIADLDSLPFPARHLTDVSRYDSVLLSRSPVTTMFTSRGCPFVCSFCDRPHLGKKFRARSARSVVAEMEECARLGISDFLIYDDTFTVRRQRVIDVCNAILERGLDIHFDVRARVDTVDREMLELMARAGCKGIHYGVEAGTEKILKVLKKGITLEQVKEMFRVTREVGIRTLAYFMIGSPSETRDDILETFNFAKELDPDFLHLAVLTPFPGTELYRDALRDGIIGEDVWAKFSASPHLGFVPPYWPENFTLDELNELLVEGYKGFYRRPEYIIRRTMEVRSLEEFVRKARAGMKLLTMRHK